MRQFGVLTIALAAFAVGVVAAVFYLGQPRQAEAHTDRYNDYIIATGAASSNPRVPTDGVWLLDYRTGKLLGTVIDRNVGRVVGWAQVDLVKEFQIQPGEDVHFMMTTGNVARGQAALYVAEVRTGRFGIYTLGPSGLGQGVSIYRNDLTTFRPDPNQQQPVQPAGGVNPRDLPPGNMVQPRPPAGNVPVVPPQPLPGDQR